jgi:hypothetical protein
MTLRYYPEHLPEDVADTIKATERHVKGKMDAWHTDRANFAEEVVMARMMEPLDEVLRNWDEMVRDLTSQEGDKAIAKLTDLVRQRSEVIKAQIDNMTPADMRLTVETLAKMEQYGEKFAELLKLTTSQEKSQFSWVEDALRYVMGLPGVNQNGSADSKERKDKVYASIVKALENPKNPTDIPEPNFSYACTLLAFAKPEDRKAIVAKALENPKLKAEPDGKKKFLTTLCHQGAVSPLEAEEYLAGEATFSDTEIGAMAALWEEKYDYIKRAQYLMGESYGAKNMANEMLTLKNVLTTFGYIAGSMTILLNGICNWKKIKEDPSYIAKIPQVWIGVGEIAAATFADSDKTLGEIVAGKDTIESWDIKKSQDGILSVVSASPRGWKTMLEGDQNFGVIALSEFVNSKLDSNENLQEKEATVAKFKEFLKFQESQNPGKNYDKILAQLEAIEGKENPETTSTRFRKLTMAFSKLKIGGDTAVETYQENLAIAQGKESPKPQTT